VEGGGAGQGVGGVGGFLGWVCVPAWDRSGQMESKSMKCDCSNERAEGIECRRWRPALVVALAALAVGQTEGGESLLWLWARLRARSRQPLLHYKLICFLAVSDHCV
jgi:hypothetical protein